MALVTGMLFISNKRKLFYVKKWNMPNKPVVEVVTDKLSLSTSYGEVENLAKRFILTKLGKAYPFFILHGFGKGLFQVFD